jgi:hypothetical protein
LVSLTPHLHWLSAITINTPEAIEPIARLGVVLLLFRTRPGEEPESTTLKSHSAKAPNGCG